MGREIFTQIRDKDGNVIWDSADHNEWFCGRDDVTNIIACRADEEGDVDITNSETFNDIIKSIDDEIESLGRAYDRAGERVEDLHAAARRAANIEIFNDFDDAIDNYLDYQRSLEGEMDAANEMIQLMRDTRSTAEDLAFKDHASGMGSYHIYWVVSE